MGMMLEINNRKNTGKLTAMKQLISNNQYAKKEITEDIRKYLRNKNITYSWNSVKAVLREIYNCKGLNFNKKISSK